MCIDTGAILYLVSYLQGKSEVKTRVVIALALLVGAKLLNISVPFVFKHAIDSLNDVTKFNVDDPCNTLSTFIFALIVGYGIARMGAAGFNELRNAVFAKVAQHSIR